MITIHKDTPWIVTIVYPLNDGELANKSSLFDSVGAYFGSPGVEQPAVEDILYFLPELEKQLFLLAIRTVYVVGDNRVQFAQFVAISHGSP